jgi:hypothetical protein
MTRLNGINSHLRVSFWPSNRQRRLTVLFLIFRSESTSSKREGHAPSRGDLKVRLNEGRPLFDRQIISSIIDSILFVKEGNANQTFKELSCLPGHASTANF